MLQVYRRNILLILLLSASLNVYAQEPSKKSPHYRDPIMPALAGRLIGPKEKTLVFRAKMPDGTTPPAGPQLEIYAASGTIVLESDADGFVRFPFRLDLLKENPPLKKVDESHRFELRLACTKRKDIRKRVELSAGNKPFVESEGIRVWYPDGQKKTAYDVLRRLESHRKAIVEELGIPPIAWGINLVKGDLSKLNATTLQDYPQWFTWTFSLNEIDSKSAERINVHEWIESSMRETISFEDGRCRFVADGLSEYGSNRYTQYIPDYYVGPLEDMLAKGDSHIDLPQKFMWPVANRKTVSNLTGSLMNFPAGYPLSFAFWEQVCAEYGRDLPKRFLSAFAKEPKKDYRACLRVLARLTGSSSIRSSLESMDVERALKLIQEFPKQTEAKEK